MFFFRPFLLPHFFSPHHSEVSEKVSETCETLFYLNYFFFFFAIWSFLDSSRVQVFLGSWPPNSIASMLFLPPLPLPPPSPEAVTSSAAHLFSFVSGSSSSENSMAYESFPNFFFFFFCCFLSGPLFENLDAFRRLVTSFPEPVHPLPHALQPAFPFLKSLTLGYQQ